MKQRKQISQARRGFLRNAGIGAGATAVAAVVPGTAFAEVDQADVKGKQEQGYHLSQHILDYYRSAAS